MKYLISLFFIATSLGLVCQDLQVERNSVIELSFHSTSSYDNPFLQVDVDVFFTEPDGEIIKVPAFWAGGDTWKVRYSSPSLGTIKFHTSCSDSKNKGLHKQKGNIDVLPYVGSSTLLQKGGVQVNENGHLVHTDGSPFLWLADSWWHGTTTRLSWPQEFKALADDRKQKGFSVIQLALGFPCDIVPFDPRGTNEAGFPTTKDYSTINPDFFNLVDQRIQYLYEIGLVPNILGTWGYYLPWFGIENMKRYWEYIIARYAAYPVTWTVAGETTLVYYLTETESKDSILDFQRNGWSEIVSYIQESDPFERVISAHPGPNSGGFTAVSDMTLLDFVMVQPGHRGWETLPRAVEHLNTARSKFPNKPIMQGEVCFEGMFGGGCDAKLQRHLFWTNMLSGAAGHCYGADAIWQFNSESQLFGPSPSGHTWGNFTWQEAYQWKGAFYVGLGRKILERYRWQEFQVNPAWISTHDPSDVLSPYAAGIPGEITLCYFPRGLAPWGTRSKVMALDPDMTYEVTYIDPLTGNRYDKGSIAGVNEWIVEPAPILQDWLVEMKVKH